MALQEFNQLPTIEKATFILENGSFADSLDTGPFRAMLYLVDDFYVEVYYHKQPIK